jgi:hypothetical protein
VPFSVKTEHKSYFRAGILNYNFAALLYQVCTVASATQAAPKGGLPTVATSAKSKG